MTAPIYASLTLHTLDAGAQTNVHLDGVVSQCCVGIAGFEFNYGDDDNNVLDMSLTASISSKTVDAAAGTSTVTIKLDGLMEDDNKHSAAVRAQVVLIAVFEGTVYTPTLATTATFSSGSSSSPEIALGGTPNVLQPMLSSFSMGYSSDDQGVNQIAATINIAGSSDNQVSLGGSCILAESTNTKADQLSLAGSLLGDPNSPSLFEIITYSPSATSSSGSVSFTNEVSSAQAVLTSFNAQYPDSDDHKLRALVTSYSYFFSPAEGIAGLQSDGRTFRFKDAFPFMIDDSDGVSMAPSLNMAGSATAASYVVIGAVEQPDSGS